MRQVHAAAHVQPDERSRRRSPAHRVRAVRRRGHPLPRRRPHRSASPGGHGLPEAERVPEVRIRQRRVRPHPARDPARTRRHRRGVAHPCWAVGRGEGRPGPQRGRPVRWPAAAAGDRPVPRRRTRGDPHGRAHGIPRPGGLVGDRGPDHGPRRRLHDRPGHSRPRAGRTRVRSDGVLRRAPARRRGPARRARRVRADRLRCSRVPPIRAPRATWPAGAPDLTRC